jgi:hypothetical protein
MFRIGVFSKLSLVPVKTLRYYDEIGLLVPASVTDSPTTATTQPTSCPASTGFWP